MKRIRIIALLLSVTILVFSMLSTAFAAGQPETMSLVVKLINGLTSIEQTALINRNGGIETSSIPALRLHVIAVPAEEASLSLQNYQSDPQVESVELNKTRKAEGTPGDLNYGVQWALSKIGWESAFGIVAPSGSAKLAILDTGVDASHPDLGSNIIPGTSILNGTNGLSDPNGHGTSLAGIVASLTNNEEGIAGIAYAGVHIMPVTVLGSNGLGQDSDIIAGIIWAADHGADVILMGFSNPDFSQNLQDAIDYAWSKGAVMVAAAGNDGVNTPTFPAGDRGVVGVSATDRNDALAGSSNYGLDVFLAAPGTDIYTTSLGNSYTYISGTSASSAIVAGVAAFMKAVDPSLTNGVIVGRLGRSADYAGTPGDPNNQTMFGNGRVNMANALADSSTVSVQPAGAAPVGAGGPFIGPYTASGLLMPIESISSSPQSSQLTNGSAGSTQFTVTVKAGSGWLNLASLSVSGLPASATDSIIQSFWDNISVDTYTTTMTITTTAATPAGSYPLTIHNSYNAVTGSATLVIGNSSAPATMALSGLTQTYDTMPKAVTVTTSPAGIPGVVVTYNGSTTAPTTVGSYAVVATLTNDNYQAAVVNGTLVIDKAAATVTLSGLTQTYDNTPKAVTVATTPAGLAGVVITYNGSATAPTAVGNYAVVATLTNENYQAAPVNGTLVIDKAAATMALSGLTQTYDTMPKAVTVATTPAGLAGVVITYNGSATAPTAVGNYAVVATLTNENYQAAPVNGTLVIDKAAATMALSGLTQTYDTMPKAVTVATTPAGLAGVVITYNGSATAPTAVGNYAVVATLTNENYQAAPVNGTLVIDKAAATMALSGLTQTYDTMPKAVTVATTPAGLAGVVITYNGSATAPTAVGNYAVVATLTNENYQAAPVNGTLVIDKAAATVTLSGLTQTYDNTPKAVTVTTSPAGIPGVVVTYNGSTTAPTAVGSYAVVATLTNDNYQAAVVNGTLVIDKAAATVTLSGLTQTYDNTPKAVTVTTSPVGLTDVSVTYDGNAVPPTNVGSYAVVVKLTNANYQTTDAVGTLVISKGLGAPAFLTVPTNNSTGYIAISWGGSDVDGATYTLEQSTDGTNFTQVFSGTALSKTVTVTADGYYTYRVKATKNGYATLDYTKAANTCHVVLTCGAPASISVPADNSTGYIAVSWGGSNIDGATYTLEQSTDGTNFTQVYSGTALSKTVTVTADGYYTYRVKAAKNGYATLDYTKATNTCHVVLTCGAPASISVPTDNSTGYIAVSWGGSNVDGATYTLEQSTDGTNFTQVFSGTALSKTVTVTADGYYTYRVKAAKNGYATLDYTKATNTCHVVLTCGAPASISVPTDNSTGLIAVSWGGSNVDGVTYTLEQSTDGTNFTQVYSGTALSKAVTVTADGYYTYRVKAAKNGYATLDYTKATNTCHVVLTCGAPASISVPTDNSTGLIAVSWGGSNVDGVTYTLEQSTDGTNFTQVYSGTALSKAVTVTADGYYTYRVKAAKNGYATLDYTKATNTCHVVLTCGAPASISVPTDNSTGLIAVSWGGSNVDGVTYTLEQSTDGTNFTQVYSGTALSKAVTVTADGYYTYRVKAAKNGYATLDYTKATNTCHVVLTCGAPASISAPTDNSTGFIPVSWGASDVSGVTYVLEQVYNGVTTTVYSGTATSKTVTVTIGGSYTFQVKATKAGYASSGYATTSVCLVTLTVGPPTSLTVPATNSTGFIPVSWGASDVSGVTYVLEQVYNGVTTTVYSGTATSKTVTVTIGGSYTFQVKATKAGYASSGYATTSVCLVTLTVGPPTSLTVPATNSTGFIPVSWGASNVSGVTYVLEQSTTENFAAYTAVYTGTGTSKTLTLANGTYYYRVMATKSGYIASGYTAVKSVTVQKP